MDELLISLDYKPEELANPEARASIKQVALDLAQAGVPMTRLVHARSGAIMAAAMPLGPYLVPAAQIIVPTLGAILVAWVKAPGRKVRVKVGDMQIEATSVEDVERLIPRLIELQAKGSRKKPKKVARSAG